jgi:hypothetical protein
MRDQIGSVLVLFGTFSRSEGCGADVGSDRRELDTGAFAAGEKRGSKDAEKNESVQRHGHSDKSLRNRNDARRTKLQELQRR